MSEEKEDIEKITTVFDYNRYVVPVLHEGKLQPISRKILSKEQEEIVARFVGWKNKEEA
jgi:hypothetical protein